MACTPENAQRLVDSCVDAIECLERTSDPVFILDTKDGHGLCIVVQGNALCAAVTEATKSLLDAHVCAPKDVL